MPLVKGDIHQNIKELVGAGHPQKQAVAIALRLAGRRGKVKLSREHCGKPDIYRIHVKHPVSGETCKIGSSCASGMLRDPGAKNLTGAMQPKAILHKAATAESLKDVGSVVKVRLRNKDTKLTKVPPDTKETLAKKDPFYPEGWITPEGKFHSTGDAKTLHADVANKNGVRGNEGAYAAKWMHVAPDGEGNLMGHHPDAEYTDLQTSKLKTIALENSLKGVGITAKKTVGMAPRFTRMLKLSREQDALWPQINDEGARLALADHLEEIGDPLHHVLRSPEVPEGPRPTGYRTYWVPTNHPKINSMYVNHYPGKDEHHVFLHSTPHELELPAISGTVNSDQLKQILEHHWDKTPKAGGGDYYNRKLGGLKLSRPDVIADANSQGQQIKKFIAAKIAKEARLKLVGIQDARGQNQSGIIQSYEAPGDEDGVDYAAAWYGLLTNQPSVTTFHESDQGPDTFYKWRVAGDPDQALKTLPPGTLVDKSGWAHYLDKGSKQPVEGVSGNRGTAVTMQGRQGYRDYIKRYQGPDDRVALAAPSSVIVKVPLPQQVTPAAPPTLKKPSPRLSYVLPF